MLTNRLSLHGPLTGNSCLPTVTKRQLDFLSHGKFRGKLIRCMGDPATKADRILWIPEEFTTCLCSRWFK